MIRNLAFVLIYFVALTFLAGCGDDYTPRPRGYNRIELLPKNYHSFDTTCPFTFDIPAYARVLPYHGPDAHPCWLNVYFAPYHATLHLSYADISSKDQLVKLTEDSRNMVYKHTIKAEEIIENYIEKPGKSGIVYELTGNTATSLQFYLTDSTRHYLRGSLYFNERTNPDSVAPVLRYLTDDVGRLIHTLAWK